MKKEKFLLFLFGGSCFLLLLVMAAVSLSRIEIPRTVTFTAAPTQIFFTPAPPSGPIDPYHATMEELDALPGIGPVTAQSLMDHVAQGGVFHFPEDLMDVRGIGEKRWADIISAMNMTLPDAPPTEKLFE